MSKIKKFGMFAGVFTPSILTILGVIMYMRLGWVVGQAGLIGAIGIIILAHIISISTGLSISSVATDKKIKTGGIYYMLSRSLGFPMGGSIGIALFIGTALSISLYLVGFAESLLGVEAIRNFLHVPANVNGYRIIGSAFLLILVIIAFVSTTLAIKTQFYILGAIFLSIVSIVIGFFIHPNLAPTAPLITSSGSSIPLEVVFAIFFPAVTGFTAGVAMSGDLKDPKKSIPSGTLLAIGVGFIIYIALAICFGFFVNRDLLVNDTNFLLKVAWIAPLVLAGIWGATLSSALGGILGGPRILQAMSADRITPKIFAKGHGASNEPRNALFLIFAIAEIGILIGELNVIAGVVSMFYLASYGFINIAYFLESWASTDFRPSFKINRYIGLVGALACFGVMFKLDMLSMFASLIIMLGIYLYLSRKNLDSESGDVWQSVGMSLVRAILNKMDKKIIEQRNWQPNIILFSGGTSSRPHLIEFGQDLVGKYGLLSNFDLHETKDKRYLFPKHLQATDSPETKAQGVFTRRQTCSDLYQGIENIAATYGFAGIVPNAILMGWARESNNPLRFTQMLKRISELDLNILLIDYDQRFGYGKYQQIDIWWRGTGRHGNLALTLLKFLWSSENWINAKLRLLIVNPVNDDAPKIKRKAETALDNLRISADIIVINNELERKDFYDIIRVESKETDLIMLGIPEIEAGKEEFFVAQTGQLMKDIGTVVLVKASSQFKALHFGTKVRRLNPDEFNKISLLVHEVPAVEISVPNNSEVTQELNKLNEELQNINTNFIDQTIQKISEGYRQLSLKVTEIIDNSININLRELVAEQNQVLQNQKLIEILEITHTKIQQSIENYSNTALENQAYLLKEAIENFIAKIDNLSIDTPDLKVITYSEDAFEITYNNKLKNKIYDLKKIRLKKTNKPITYELQYSKLIGTYLPLYPLLSLQKVMKKIGTSSISYNLALQKFISKYKHSLLDLIENNSKTLFKEHQLAEIESKFLKEATAFLEKEQLEMTKIAAFLQTQTVEIVKELNGNLVNININKLLDRAKYSKETVPTLIEDFGQLHKIWEKNTLELFNGSSFEMQLAILKMQLSTVIKKCKLDTQNIINNTVTKKIVLTNNYLKSFIIAFEKNQKTLFLPPDLEGTPQKETIYLAFKEALDESFDQLKAASEKFPQSISLITNESYNNFIENQFTEVEVINITASKLLDFLIHDELSSHLLIEIDKLPQRILKNEIETQNILRLAKFSFFNTVGELINLEENQTEKILLFINEQVKKLDNLILDTTQVTNNIHKKFNDRLMAVSINLSVPTFINLAGNFRQYRFKAEKKNSVSFLKSKYITTKDFINKQINKLWYRHSDALLLAKQIEESQETKKTKVDDILNFYEKISLKGNILEVMPFYYQQLFLRKHNYSNEFWFGRKKELFAIEKALERRNNGFNGALMITGENNSGKTFLVHYATAKFAPKSKLIIINPPFEGSINPTIFKQKLSEATGQQGEYTTIFASIPPESILLFEDTELWFEKSKGGLKVIKEIIELIEKFGDKHLFIININKETYELINKMMPIENYFLNTINCNPFNAETLMNIVMFRHNSSGIQFQLEKKAQDKLNQRDLAKLFAKHFSYSHGNVGTTLLSWTANIQNFKENKMHITEPKQPDTFAIDNLRQETLMILTQLILHRRMNMKKLERTTFQLRETLSKEINYLKRTGLVSEENDNIYEINKFMYQHIHRKLISIEML